MLQRNDPQVAKFYKSKAWQRCRDVYMQRHCYVCEICGRSASICHHVIPVTAANVNDVMVTMNSDNLLCVCYACHNRIHSDEQHPRKVCRDNLMFDANGNLVEVIKEER